MKTAVPEHLSSWRCSSLVHRIPYHCANLRSKALYHLEIDPLTPVLHRFVPGTVGRPLWEYTSELDLLTSFPAAL